MTTRLIISYDGTKNEEDALALGRLFAQAGAEVALAYVRHAKEHEAATSTDLGEAQAEELLTRGAHLYGDPALPRHVVDDRSTPAGLLALSGTLAAAGVIFCSDSHTGPGRVSIGNSARWLIEGGPLAVGIAPAGLYQARPAALREVALLGADPAAEETVERLCAASGARRAARASGAEALLVVASRPEARPGTVALSAAAEGEIEEARSPVLVLARTLALSFGS